MVRKSGLGKGLDALIPGSEFQPPDKHDPSEQSGITQLPVDRIQPNPHQPRVYFDPLEMDELASSIQKHGVIQPLLVTRGSQDEPYILIAGERRLIAARQAGLAKVPVIIREASDQERVELALIENIQRADLGPLETAEAYRQLSEEYNMAHDQIAARVGKSRTSVTNTLRLLKLPQAVQKALIEGQITEGHARALLSLPTSQAQLAALQTILKNALNVRQTEELTRKLTGQKPKTSVKKSQQPEIQFLESRLRESLGTKVNLNQKRKGGTLVIHYYSQEELDQIVNRILDE